MAISALENMDMAMHPSNPGKPYTHWKVKLAHRLHALEAHPDPKPDWVLARIANLRKRLNTSHGQNQHTNTKHTE